MLDIRELDKSVLTRLNRIESRLSCGDTTSYDFEEQGIDQKIETLKADIDRLEVAITDLELNA